MSTATVPVFDIPAYPGTGVQGGALAAAKAAAHFPVLDLRDLPQPPRQVRGQQPAP